MRLLDLHLLAFGAFSDATLRFAEDGAKVHVVYGKNEAGKSTALRAIKALLYGVPGNTPDGHLHRLDKLRVGARLRDRSGRTLDVVRRKGNKNTLLALDGTPLPASEEAWLTAGVIEPQYDALFGLSYETLSAKALETLGGEGGLGESLLGASMGGRSVHETLKALRTEADDLYRPRGRNQKINELLSALEDEKRKVRDEAQHAETFTKQEAAISETEANVERLRAQRQALRTERERLDRARRVLPLLGRRAELMRERSQLGDVRLLSADAAEQRVRVEETLRGEAGRMQELSVEIDALKAGLDKLVGPTPQRVLEPALARQVREHAARQGVLVGDLAKKDKALSLRDQELAQLAARSRAHFATLARVEGADLPLLAQLALPSRDVVSDFEHRMSSCDIALAGARERHRELQADLERVRRESADLVAGTTLPSEAELLTLRQARGETLMRLRGLVADPASAHSAFSSGGEGVVLLTQLDTQIDRADLVGDRLRHEAARVERHARLSHEQALLEARLREQEAEQARLQEALSGVQREWLALWRGAGVQPTAPRAMQAWLQQQREYESKHEQLQEVQRVLREERAEVEGLLQHWQTTWERLMQAVGLPATALAAEAEARIEAQAARVAAQRALDEAERRRSVARERHEAARGALATLMAAADVKDPAALPDREARSMRCRQLESELAKLQTELLSAGDGQSAEVLDDETRGLRIEDVRARLGALEDEIETIENEVEQAASTLERQKQGLQSLKQRHGAADAASRAAEHVTTLRTHGERYVRLRLAAALLEQEIAQYRERHKGPLLRTAGEYFARLTLGVFSDLQADYGDADQPMLACVRANGERVPLSGLSSGTRDQLFLALRLSSVRERAEQHEPLPLLLDDVLVHFDEDRARAALGLLADIAGIAQVILFTHHERVRDLAREALAPAQLDVHELSVAGRG